MTLKKVPVLYLSLNNKYVLDSGKILISLFLMYAKCLNFMEQVRMFHSAQSDKWNWTDYVSNYVRHHFEDDHYLCS